MNILAKALYGVLYLLSLLPLWVHYIFSDIIYLIVYYVVRYRVKIVRKNLATSFPEKSDEERRYIERRFYRWFGDYLVESVKLLSISKKQLRRRLQFKGTDAVDQVVNEGRSCAVYLGHYCNWEWITSLPLWVSEKAQCGQIYHPLEDKEFDKIFLKLRQRMGAVCIPMAQAARSIIKLQKERPMVIGYIADQVPFWQDIHHWLDFLHHDTPVLTGTERLACMLNHAVFYLDVQCIRRGYYVAEFKLISLKPKELPEFELTNTYFRLLEESIRRNPPYWLWTHNRWKRTHEEYLQRLDPETGMLDTSGDMWMTRVRQDESRRRKLKETEAAAKNAE